MVYLWGYNGSQKTSMAQACAKEIVKQGYSVHYVVMNSLVNALMYKEGNEEDNSLIKRCLDVDLLIIDVSFDAKKVTLYKSGYQIPYLDNFIRQRFEIDKKSILFISNKLPNEIEKQGFDFSIQNLVERNTRNSLLKFEDIYFEQEGIGIPDRLGLFK
jgi:DNA replication protein DnaC